MRLRPWPTLGLLAVGLGLAGAYAFLGLPWWLGLLITLGTGLFWPWAITEPKR